jgi:hypothetical protein
MSPFFAGLFRAIVDRQNVEPIQSYVAFSIRATFGRLRKRREKFEWHMSILESGTFRDEGNEFVDEGLLHAAAITLFPKSFSDFEQ